jgi:hypothetical protein
MTAASLAIRTEPWGYIAKKGGYWHSAALASIPHADLEAFKREALEDGFEVEAVYTFQEYQRVLRTRQHWSLSPEYQAKHGGDGV